MTKQIKQYLTPEQRAECIRWAEELESGRRRQANSVLRSYDGGDCSYCCLGVYGDIGGGPQSPTRWGANPDSKNYEAPFVGNLQVGGIGGDEYLKRDWFEERTGMRYGHQVELAGHNDSGYTFLTIAGAIRYFAEHGALPDAGYWQERESETKTEEIGG